MDEPMDSYDPGKFEEDLDNGIESNDDKDPLKGLEEVSEAESHDPEDLWEPLEEMSEAEPNDPQDFWESLEEISEDDYRRHKQELDEMKKQADNIKTEDDEDIFNIPTAVTSWGRNVYTKPSLTDYYKDQASGDEPTMGSFEDSSAMFDSFADQIGREKARVVSDVIRAWVNDEKPIGCDSTAPLWYNFAESYDNFNMPVDLEEVTIDSDDLDALRSFSEFTEQEFRDRYGDSLVLYRNVDKSGLEVMEKENSETGSMVLDHRPLESWTLDPEIAEDWQTGFILRKEVDVEDIIASQVTYPGFIPGEKEVIVGSEGREKYSEDEVVHTSEFDVEQNAEWALSKLGSSTDGVEKRIEGPEWMDLDNAVGSRSLQESGAITENKSSQFMRVAEYENGREAFVTELSSSEYQDETGADPVEAERALAGEQFFESIGLEKYIPSHFVDLEEGYMAVESVDGYEIDKAPEEARNQVNTDEYLKFAAATILSGNSDMDGKNTMIDEEGHIHGIDIDHAGGDFTEGGRHYRRAMKSLKENADKLGLEIDYSNIKKATQIVADQIDPFKATEGIEPSQVSNRDMYDFRNNIINNITSFAGSKFPGEFEQVGDLGFAYEEEAIRV